MAKATSRMIRCSIGHDRMAEDVVAVMDAAGIADAPYDRLFHGRLYRLAVAGALSGRACRAWRWAAWAKLSHGPAHLRSERPRSMIAEALLDRGQGQHHRSRAPACFANSPTSPARTGWRWPPACGRCRRPCRRETLANVAAAGAGGVRRPGYSRRRLRPSCRHLSRMALPQSCPAATTCRRWATVRPARR